MSSFIFPEFTPNVIKGLMISFAFFGTLNLVLFLGFLVNVKDRTHKDIYMGIFGTICCLILISPLFEDYYAIFQLLNHHYLFFSFK